MYLISLLFKHLSTLPLFLFYQIYDHLIYWYFRKYQLFDGWGIHLYTGKFGQGKTMLQTIKAYNIAVKYPQVTIVTNYELKNFPAHTKILPLNTAQDILNAPKNSLILIDEIGTLFNSRDFSSGKNSIPKPLFQHLCQVRKRRLMIYATVQRFNLLDKQIRDITATVTSCACSGRHPFSRKITALTYDIDEYEAAQTNRLYLPRPMDTTVCIQKDFYRQLYDTSTLIQGLLTKDYLSDEEILRNQGALPEFIDSSKDGQKAFKKAQRRKRR